MPKFLNLLIRPELLCIIFYVIVTVIIKSTNSPIKSMDPYWENMGFVIPLVLIPLTFALYYVPGAIHKFLLLRIWIAGILGGHYVMDRSLNAHSEGGPGVGTIYIMGMGMVFFMLIAGTVFAVIKFR